MRHATKHGERLYGLLVLTALALPACQEPSAKTEAPSAAAATSATAGCNGLELRLVALYGTDVPRAEIATYGGSEFTLEPGECYRVERTRVVELGFGYAVEFEIAPADYQRFHDFTGSHLNRGLALIVDGEIATLATIRSALPPVGVLQSTTSGDWTRAHAESIAAALKPGG